MIVLNWMSVGRCNQILLDQRSWSGEEKTEGQEFDCLVQEKERSCWAEREDFEVSQKKVADMLPEKMAVFEFLMGFQVRKSDRGESV